LFDHGTLICWLAASIHRPWPGPYGPASVREIVSRPQLETVLERIGRITGYHGLCGIDLIQDARDQLLVLELNARPTNGYHPGRVVGVDFAKSIRAMLPGTRYVQRPQLGRGRPPAVYLFP